MKIEDPLWGEAGVAILFEASPGFQHVYAHAYVNPGVRDTAVAILFEASPGFQPPHVLILDYLQRMVGESQSSLKRVLVSNGVQRVLGLCRGVCRNPL